jgi:hypothetical protein
MGKEKIGKGVVGKEVGKIEMRVVRPMRMGIGEMGEWEWESEGVGRRRKRCGRSQHWTRSLNCCRCRIIGHTIKTKVGKQQKLELLRKHHRY